MNRKKLLVNMPPSFSRNFPIEEKLQHLAGRIYDASDIVSSGHQNSFHLQPNVETSCGNAN